MLGAALTAAGALEVVDAASLRVGKGGARATLGGRFAGLGLELDEGTIVRLPAGEVGAQPRKYHPARCMPAASPIVIGIRDASPFKETGLLSPCICSERSL